MHKKVMLDLSSLKIRSGISATVCMSMGFTMCPLMPHSKAFFLSSSKAFAVMATVGIFRINSLALLPIGEVMSNFLRASKTASQFRMLNSPFVKCMTFSPAGDK